MNAIVEALLEEIETHPAVLDRLAVALGPLLAEQSAKQSDDGWLRGADKIARHIDAPVSRVYALASSKRIPVYRDGSALVARKSDLDDWMRAGGGKRS